MNDSPRAGSLTGKGWGNLLSVPSAPIAEGSRNASLASLGGTMGRRGFSEGDADGDGGYGSGGVGRLMKGVSGCVNGGVSGRLEMVAGTRLEVVQAEPPMVVVFPDD